MASDDALRRTVFLRRLPKKLREAELRGALPDAVEDVFLLHSRGTAQVQFADAAAAEALVAAETLRIGAKAADVAWAKQPIRRDRPPEARQEARRALDAVIRGVLDRQGKANRKRKAVNARDFRKALAAAGQDVGHFELCWDFAASGGRACPRGDACRFRHETPTGSVTAALPPRKRHLRCQDSFPATRQYDPVKDLVNKELAALCANADAGMGVVSPLALVLDGTEGKSTQALLAGGTRGSQATRQAHHIVVPNSAFATYRELGAKGLCIPHFGSLRSYLDACVEHQTLRVVSAEESQASNSEATRGKIMARPAGGDLEPAAFQDARGFGCIYLDYCCRLRAGFKQIEASPVADIRMLLRSVRDVTDLAPDAPRARPTFIDSEGCILAVCLRKEAVKPSPKPVANGNAVAAALASWPRTLASLLPPDWKNVAASLEARPEALTEAPVALDAPTALACLVAEEAARAGLVATKLRQGIEYGGAAGNFVEFFRLHVDTCEAQGTEAGAEGSAGVPATAGRADKKD